MIIDRETAVALDKQHRTELRGMTPREALVATDRLLAMAVQAPYSPEKESSPGLVEQQRILYGLK